MINETLKLVQSKRKNGLIIPIHTLNIFMDISIYNEIYYLNNNNNNK